MSLHRIAGSVRRTAFVIFGLLPAASFGWGHEGHAMVGDVASFFLTTETRQRISELLVDDLNAQGQPSGRKTLGEIASWPDEIRDTPKGKGVAPWHFDDVPVCGNVPKSQWCPQGNCASEQIVRHYEALRNPLTSPLEKNEALKWIVHLVGDIHQPLHSANNDDRGGNNIKVKFLGFTAGGHLNLHSVWDTQLPLRLIQDKGMTAEGLARAITAQQQTDWAKGTLTDWVAEGTALARSVAYGKLPTGLACGSPITAMQDLGGDYYAAAGPVVQSQIQKGGYRLAGILNSAFQSPPPPVTPKASTSLISSTSPAPLLEKGRPVDWWFTFKLSSKAFPECGGAQRVCSFGGLPQNYVFGQQFVYASSAAPTLQKGSGCVGTTPTDPVGATFGPVYGGSPFFVVWNDQFYDDPVIAGCTKSCSSPWGHSKGMLVWNAAGEGFVMQVSTPSWPAAGSYLSPRKTDGNTLGCVRDDDVKVSQHFFALRLGKDDLVKVLRALRNASVVTNPADPQIVNNGGPEDVTALVAGLGTKTEGKAITKDTLSTGVQLISKPSGLHVPPWQMVSAVLGGVPLRTATWWAKPEIPSTTATTAVSCWDASLGKPGAVQIATTGQWGGKTFGLKGGDGPDFNHAKIGVSTDSSNYAIFGDMNQQGALGGGKCNSSQDGRGGLFYVVKDARLAQSVADLIKGDTAPTP